MAKTAAKKQQRDIPTEVKDPQLVKARRRQIVDATVQLFFAKGFHKTTTREIAKAAGFSIGTLYEYVKSKEDVLYLVCEAIHQEIEERLRERLPNSGRGVAALGAAMEEYFLVCDAMSDHILLIYQETASLPPESMRYVLANDERIAGIFKELLEAGCRDYSFRPLTEKEIELMAGNIVVLGHMWAFRRWSLKTGFTLDEYIELQRSLILGELTSPPAGRGEY